MHAVATLLTLAVLSPLLRTQEPTTAQRAVFALLDSFDPLDTRSLPFVEVTTGQWIGMPRENTRRLGFLLQADGHTFRIRYLELGTAVLANTRPGTPAYDQVGFRPVDLRACADEFAERLRTRRRDERAFASSYYHAALHPDTQALLLARACARLGLQEQVDALWGALDPAWRTREGLVAVALTREFALDLGQRLVLDCGDPTLSWQDLLARHEHWLATFPATAFAADEVAARRDALAALVAQPPPVVSRDSSTDELIRGLGSVYRPWLDWWHPITPDQPPPAASAEPFDRLVERGLLAVPALLAALQDQRPTRSVRQGFQWAHVRPLGELANDVLQEISGLPFSEAAKWQPWYERATRDGIRTCLAEFMRSGDSRSSFAVSAWLQRWPEDPEPALAATVASGDRWDFLRVLAQSPAARDPRVLAALQRGARHGKERSYVRELLLGLGTTTFVDDVLMAWRDGAVPDQENLSLLLCSGRVDALRTLEAQLEIAAVRAVFAAALQPLDPPDLWTLVAPADRAAFTVPLRACLQRLLGDQEPFGVDVKLAYEGRVVLLHTATRADVAATVLAGQWRNEFPFDPRGTASERRRQLEVLRGGAERVGATAESGRVAELPLPKQNVVREVVLAPSAKGLPLAVLQQLTALRGQELEPTLLIETALAAADQDACKGQQAVLHLERNRDGVVVRIELEAHAGDASQLAGSLRITSGGAQLASHTFQDRLGTAEVNAAFLRRELLWRLRLGVAVPPPAGVEMTLALRMR